MPILDDIKQHYPDDWQEIRAAVLERSASRETTEHGQPMPTTWEGKQRDGAACEWCGKPDGMQVPIHDETGLWEWLAGETKIEVRDERGGVVATYEGCEVADAEYRMVKTVLTIAHLDQDPRGDDPERLRALCQRCHLTYDKQPAQRARRERIYAELRGQTTLFA